MDITGGMPRTLLALLHGHYWRNATNITGSTQWTLLAQCHQHYWLYTMDITGAMPPTLLALHHGHYLLYATDATHAKTGIRCPFAALPVVVPYDLFRTRTLSADHPSRHASHVVPAAEATLVVLVCLTSARPHTSGPSRAWLARRISCRTQYVKLCTIYITVVRQGQSCVDDSGYAISVKVCVHVLISPF